MISSNDIAINQYNQENKLLKKEKKLHTQFIIDLTNENIEINKKLSDYEKLFDNYQDLLKDIFKKELDNIRINYGFLKEFYYDEIYLAKSIIQELSITIDDILLK
jgi:hypothetical protein